MSLPSTQLPPPGAESVGQDIRDIRGLVEIPSAWDLLWWGIAFLAGVALLLLAVRRLRRSAPDTPPPSAQEVAFAALERARRWMAPDQSERFGTAVSQAVRQYIEDRFGVSAPKRTTEEFLRGLTKDPEANLSPHLPALETLLQRMDLVKFARSPLDESQMEELLDTASDFVKSTNPTAEESQT